MFCGKCGTPLPDGARFCSRCGSMVGNYYNGLQNQGVVNNNLKNTYDEPVRSKAPSKPSGLSGGKIAVFSLLGTAVVVGGVTLALGLFSKDNKKDTENIGFNTGIIEESKTDGMGNTAAEEYLTEAEDASGTPKNKEVIERTRKSITAYNGNDTIRWIENYNADGIRTDIKNDSGDILTAYDYDGSGNCIRETYYSEGMEKGHVERSYDSYGNCIREISENNVNGYEKTFEYDAYGNMVRSVMTTHDGYTTIQENRYNLDGNLFSWTGIDASGDEEHIEYYYNDQGFRTGGEYYENGVLESTYEIETDERGNITKESRVSDGEVLNSQSYEYDIYGNVVKYYKNNELYEENEYDGNGNRTKHILYDGTEIKQYWIYEYWD